MNSTVKTIVFWMVIILSGLLLWTVVKSGGAGAKEQDISFSEFMYQVDQGNVSEVARTLGTSRSQVRRLAARLGVDLDRHRT